MKHLSKKFFVLLGALFLSCSIAGCGNSGSTGGDATVSSVSVTPATLTLDLTNKKTGTLTAKVNGTNNPSQNVTWGSSNPSVAKVERGVVTALGTGSTVITATSTLDTSKKGTCNVTVSSGSSGTGEGEGTVTSPFNIARAVDMAKSMAADEQTSMKYFIKGIIAGTPDISAVAQYGNANFYLKDSTSSSVSFYCFQVYYLNAAKFTSTTAASLKAGDTIVMFSSIVNFRGTTPETTSKGSAYVYQHNDAKSSTVPEQGFPQPDPNAKVRTISALISENSSWKTEGAKDSTLYRISGIAQYAVNSNWGNFDLLDSTGYIYVHGCTGNKKGLVNDGTNGKVIDNDKSFSGIGIQPGDEVTIEGWYAYHKYTNSYGIPQFTGYVTALTKNGASKIESKSYTAAESYTGTYYDSVSTYSGKELLKGLHNLMDTTHSTYTSYGSLDNYFKTSDPHSSGGVKCFYSGEKASSFNKEHVWPQSLSNNLYGEDHGGSDLHHIRPTINNYNSMRSSAMFGYVYGSGSYKGRTISYQGGGTDYSITNVFEPADSIKGDVARIIMYMYMHYNDGTISELSSLTGWNKQSYYGQMNAHWVMGPASSKDTFLLLRYWNAIDPVSQDEKTRNENAYQVQGNRNPFIDHPTYADKIWG